MCKEKDSLIAAVLHNDVAQVNVLLATGLVSADTIKEGDPYDGCSLLFIAASRGYKDIAEVLLREGANVNLATISGTTPLAVAITNGHKDIVALLLKAIVLSKSYTQVLDILLAAGTNIVALSKDYGEILLFAAAQKGHKELVEILLQLGVKVNLDRSDLVTPLYIAAREGHKEVVEILLQAGAKTVSISHIAKQLSSAVFEVHKEVIASLLQETAKIDALMNDEAAQLNAVTIAELLLQVVGKINLPGNEGITLFWTAAHAGQNEVVEALLRAGAKIELAKNNGATPLHAAAEKGHTEVVELLLRAGAKVDSAKNNGASPLLIAAQDGHKEVVEVLLRAGANIDLCKNDCGITPLFIATQNSHKEVVEVLLRAGANIDLANKYGWTPLLIAAQDGLKEVVEILLKAGANIDLADKDGWTPLLIAAHQGHEKIVVVLLAAGAKIDSGNKNGATPLYIAAQNGHKEIVEVLLKAEANIDSADKDGATPLYIVAQNGHKEVVEILLKAGANIDSARNDGWTPLYIASWNGHKEVVEILLKAGANIDLADKDGWTPLLIAAHQGHAEIVVVLLAAGANIDLAEKSIGATPLYIAAQEGHKEVVALLLKAGANIDSARNDGWTPLYIAAWNGHKEVVEILLRAGAKIDLAEKSIGGTPLYVAAERGHKEVVDLLLKAGASIDSAWKDGATPLYIAAQNGHKEVVEVLLAAGAKIDSGNKNGATPLYIAAQNGHKEIVEVLLKAEANIDSADKDGWTPLLIAAHQGHAEIVVVLLAAGANIDSARKDGATPLFIAAQNGHKEVIALLLAAGAKIIDSVKDYGTMLLFIAAQNGCCKAVEALLQAGLKVDLDRGDQITPLYVAAENGHKEVVEILLHAGAKINLVNKDRWTLLMLAAFNDHRKAVELLLQAGAKIDLVNNDGATPLYIAAQEGRKKVVEILLRAKAKVDIPRNNGATPLIIATQKGHKEVVELLLQAEANFELKTKFGKTALDIARENGYTELVTILEQSYRLKPLRKNLQDLGAEVKKVLLPVQGNRNAAFLSRSDRQELSEILAYLETPPERLDEASLTEGIRYLESKRDWLKKLPTALANATKKHARKLRELKKIFAQAIKILTPIAKQNDLRLLPKKEREELQAFITYLKPLQPDTLDKADLREALKSLGSRISYLEALPNRFLAIRRRIAELAALRKEILQTRSIGVLAQDDHSTLQEFLDHITSLNPEVLDEEQLQEEFKYIALHQELASSEGKVQEAVQQGQYQVALETYSAIKACYEKLAALGKDCSKQLQEIERKSKKAELIQKLNCRIIPYPELKFDEVKLGQGNFGSVWRGTWGAETIAIKKLHEGQVATGDQLDFLIAFIEEINIMQRLDSERLVRLLGVCFDPYCIVMEYMPQGSLYSLIHGKEQYRWSLLLQIAIDIGKGLYFLHEEGIIHRDLKSLNVLIDNHHRAKICDFGLARVKSESASRLISKHIVGTMAYLPPELLTAPQGTAPYSRATDIYAYGIVLWEVQNLLLEPNKRKDPFSGFNPGLIVAQVIQGNRPEIPVTCFPVYRETIKRCWAQLPEERPLASDVVDVLQGELTKLSLKAWDIEPSLKPSGTNAEGYYLIPAGDYDMQKVVACYQRCPVPGMEVGRVTIILNPILEQSFATMLLLERKPLTPTGPYLYLKSKDPEVTTRLPMGYLFTLDKLYYVNSTLTEIPINSLQLAALKTKLGITVDAMDKEPQPLSYAALQIIAEVTSNITELEIATWRQELLRQLETMAHPYQDPELPSVKLVPVWHGTKKDMVSSIAQAGYANLASTDVGFFGKGLYGSYEAEYAYRVYGPGRLGADGVLLMNWVSCDVVYPVVGYEVRGYTGIMPDATDEPGDILKLQGGYKFENHDTHFAPVRPSKMNPDACYYPCRPGERATYHEVVVFDRNRMLPRYVVELQPSLVRPLVTLGLFAQQQEPQETNPAPVIKLN